MHPPAPPVQLPPSLGVSNCYVFKSRLQEYAQKVGFSTPIYETLKEGPPHEPLFQSTVIVNNARYDSLPGFSNRKAAEQSAAEVALIELANCGDDKNAIRQPVHEIGLCKNLLQEYAQKMNYAIPSYECKREDKAGRGNYSCIVNIGGIQYVGAVAKTKKEAEIKAARTALLAIQTNPSQNEEVANEETQYTVVPCKRKETESITPKQESAKTRKPKRSRLKKKPFNKKRRAGGINSIQDGHVVVGTNLGDTTIQAGRDDGVNTYLGTEVINVPSVDTNLDAEAIAKPSGNPSTDETMPHDGTLNMSQSYGDKSSYDGTAIQAGLVDAINTNLGTEVVIDVPSVDTNLGTEVTTTPYENFSTDEIRPCDGTLNMSQSLGDNSTSKGGVVTTLPSHGDTSTSEGANATTVPSGNSAMDEIRPHDETLNGNQSHGATSTSEGMLSLGVQMSDCQPILLNDTAN